MQKKIDIKNRIVDMYNVDTGQYESEIVDYLDRQMRVCFHSAVFNNSIYVFIRKASDQSANSIMVSAYRKKKSGERNSVSFE
jgi:hypothetical protein